MRNLTAGPGTRRYAMSRKVLRAQCERLDRENNNLTCALVAAAGEVDRAVRDRDAHEGAVSAAATRIAELTEQLNREALARTELQASNAALQAALASARKAAALELTATRGDLVNTTATAWKAAPEPETVTAPAPRQPAWRDMATGLLATRSFTVIPATRAGAAH